MKSQEAGFFSTAPPDEIVRDSKAWPHDHCLRDHSLSKPLAATFEGLFHSG